MKFGEIGYRLDFGRFIFRFDGEGFVCLWRCRGVELGFAVLFGEMTVFFV